MRLQPEQRRAIIVTAAVRLATAKGLAAVNHGEVAKQCTIATSTKTVRHYFSTQADLWKSVVAEDGKFKEQGRELGI